MKILMQLNKEEVNGLETRKDGNGYGDGDGNGYGNGYGDGDGNGYGW